MTRIGMAIDPAREHARIDRRRRRDRLRPWFEGLIALLAVAIMATGIWVQTSNTSTALDQDALLAEFADEVGSGGTTPPGADTASASTDGDQPAATSSAATPVAPADEASASTAPQAGADANADANAEEPAADDGQAPAADAPAEEAPAQPQAATPMFVLPAEGVYTYASEGHEQISIAGARHDYPEETYIVLRHEGGCQYSLDHRILEEKRSKSTLCSEGPLIRRVRYDGEVTFFGQTEESNYACEGTVADLRDGPGATHQGRCQDENGNSQTHDEVTFVGVETLVIGGTSVQALHYHQESEMTGDVRGSGTSDYWYHPDTGLPLRIERRTQSFANAFGGDVEYNEEATFQLVSLQPQR